MSQTVNEIENIIVKLSPTKMIAWADNIELKVKDVVDYVDDDKVLSGIIDQFMLIDPDDMKSVWMKVRDLNGGDGGVYSIRNWKNYINQGILKH